MALIVARNFAKMKRTGKRIVALTAYDASFAQLVAASGTDTVLVGDSLGMVIHGAPRTHGVSLADIIYHVRCVTRGAPDLHVMADLPFGSYETGPEQAFRSAVKLIAAGAHMVKLEGEAALAPTVAYLVERGIPVCGHVGLLPQSALASGWKVQGKDGVAAQRIKDAAIAVSEAGATLVVLELIPAKLAATITTTIAAATIGIGAGRDCDGQILVLYDAIGVFPRPPSFSKNFLAAGGSIGNALSSYVTAVREGRFPEDDNIPT